MRRPPQRAARRAGLVVVCFAALAAGGCGEWQPVEPVVAPALDAAAAFPELRRGGAPASAAAPAGGSTFARDLARRTSWGPAGAAADDGGGGVVLAGRFVADLPGGAAGSWRAACDGEATLLAHTPGGGVPDALLYAEAFPPLMTARPSAETARFALTVAPGLVDQQLAFPAAVTAWAEPLARSWTERRQLRRLAWMAATRTGGRGLGFTTSPRSFTGWRWIGGSRQGVSLRLARTHGEWSGQASLAPELQALLPRVVERFPNLAWLAPVHGAVGPWSGPGATRAAAPAYMLLGTASSPGAGMHLAILCAQTPECAPARDLADLLTSLRPAGRDDLGRQHVAEPASLEAFAAELGLAFAPAAGRLEPGRPPA